jgi:DNA-binding response OmpR family regulator
MSRGGGKSGRAFAAPGDACRIPASFDEAVAVMAARRRGQPISAANLVLVVGDHPEIRELLTQYLIRSGLIAVPVPDGAQAAIMCETLRPDLILVDLMLPDLDGLMLIRRLKAQYARAPLVVISARLNSGREVECRTAGADDVLPKPLNLRRLGRTLSRLLRSPRRGFRERSPRSNANTPTRC